MLLLPQAIQLIASTGACAPVKNRQPGRGMCVWPARCRPDTHTDVSAITPASPPSGESASCIFSTPVFVPPKVSLDSNSIKKRLLLAYARALYRNGFVIVVCRRCVWLDQVIRPECASNQIGRGEGRRGKGGVAGLPRVIAILPLADADAADVSKECRCDRHGCCPDGMTGWPHSVILMSESYPTFHFSALPLPTLE